MSEIINNGHIDKQVNIQEVKEFHLHPNNSEKIKADDLTSLNAWNGLSKPEDIRNFKDKFLAICSDFSISKLNKYNRNLVEGKYEQTIYDERDISSLKFIVFDKCQDRLIDFYEKNQSKKNLDKNEVEELINLYIIDERQIIKDKQQVYKYPDVTDDFIKKLVFDLIDECFLSFDEKGIYDD